MIFSIYRVETVYGGGTPIILRSPANEPLTGAVASSSALDLVDSSHLSG